MRMKRRWSSSTVILVALGISAHAACGRTGIRNGSNQVGETTGNEDAGRLGGVSGTGGGFGGTTGSGGGFGGATGSGGSTSEKDGGVDAGNVLPSCAPGPLIDDMEDGSGRICGGSGRVGVWYAFNDGLGSQVPAPTTAGEPISPVEIPGGRGASRRAMHTLGTGFTDWGVGIGIDLDYDGTRYGRYDASAFTGITFWARSDILDAGLMVRIGTAATTMDIYGGVCTKEPCYPADIILRPEVGWTRYWVPFTHLVSQSSSSRGVEVNKLTNIQFMAVDHGDFDFWIDDLAFFSGSPDCCPTPPPGCTGAIKFSGIDLEGDLRTAIGKPTGDLTCRDVCALDGLWIYGPKSIKSLAGLECAVNLTTLTIDGTQVSDLAPLAGLHSLRRLSVNDSQVSNLSPLSGLRLLRNLDVMKSQVSDVGPLAGLSELGTLDLSSNRIADLRPLSELTSLRNLTLVDNQITDDILRTSFAPSGWSNLSGFTRLDLGNNRITDLQPLARLANLQALDVAYNQITDASPLASLANLSMLDLANNQMDSLKSIVNLVNLSSLGLTYNNIEVLDPLLDNPGLDEDDELWLTGNPVRCDDNATKVLKMLRDRGVRIDPYVVMSAAGPPPVCQ
jgi:hypothetical protein